MIATMFLLVGFFSIAKQVWKINEESGYHDTVIEDELGAQEGRGHTRDSPSGLGILGGSVGAIGHRRQALSDHEKAGQEELDETFREAEVDKSGHRYSLPEYTLDQNPTEAVSPDLLDNQTVYQGERLGVIDVIEYEAVEDDEEEAADEGEDEGEDFISEEEEEISIEKFQGLDHDGNGFLSAAELRHVVNQDEATDELVEKVFRYVDADGDGQIDPDEFVEVDAWDRRGGEN